MEALPGAAGFQYFFLLLPAALLIRRRDEALVLAAGLAAALVILAVLPNLRYLYGVLPIFSIVLVLLLRVRFAAALFAALVAVNLYFLPSSNSYHPSFALFRKSEIASYVERLAPERLLIDHLNAAAPGQAVAIFGASGIAGLRAPAYSDNWHSEHYWKIVRGASTPADIRGHLAGRDIRYVIAPISRTAQFRVVREFLTLWLDPAGPTAGPLGVFRVRDSAIAPERDTSPLQPGIYDDTTDRFEYSGNWTEDHQFPEPASGSITYSDVAGHSVRFSFEGTRVVYWFTRALNRGVAEVRIDGRVRAWIDAYSPRTRWQAKREFMVSGDAPHTFELHVTGRKNARSSGVFVDIDQIEVR
jgi:hypothetical protein